MNAAGHSIATSLASPACAHCGAWHAATRLLLMPRLAPEE